MTTRADRFENPLAFFEDSAGTPYAGAQLFFYASGTSTKLATYSDATLSTPNLNPIVLDSAGRLPNAVFLQNLAYKVVLAPSTDTDPPTSPIWTQDPVYGANYSTVAQFQSGSGNPTGQVAGSAGGPTIPASSYWDYTNQLLYICTATGTASTAGWTAINSSTAANVVPAPQGYITVTSGTPTIPSDVVAATTVYYTPYVGDDVPIYNGTSFTPLSIVSELSLTLSSSHVANNIYDFYAFLVNGVVTFGTGPSWSAGTGGSVTAGSCARGTGAGGAALTMVQGINTNAVSMTMRYGNGTQTTTVAANQATYLGSMFVDGTNGQVSCYRSWGQNRKWGIWNAYNRQRVYLKVGDNTATWTYGTQNTWRPSNNSTNNKLTTFCGLTEGQIDVRMYQLVTPGSNGDALIGIGINSTTAPTGTAGRIANNSAGAANSISAEHTFTSGIGIQDITALEEYTGASGNATFSGTQTNMLLFADWTG